ncbi:uncharacterized protein BDR25DRAFT_255125 [Lindgomyces ingoldianus]|uniref:Uncharacterized protein n=1 Tax=Lindgomyces ingoldianus TaxID=673940 RepID=A0ACB6R626_9PLEO|nr:uncharacterized protein BDR25DRAFT_255125 [Lindgomyces ingoldianus]KAF2474738.1 hypothetical protein BDR25DRAFT_255125 [Lindgomyces ingoldianus]
MPRRRPPGAGPGLSTSLLLTLLVLPWVTSTAAQQQQPPLNVNRRSPRQEARVDTIIPERPAQPDQGRPENATKRSRHTPIIAQNERAVATHISSAPAVSAVRAPPTGNAAPSSGGLTRPSARSLKDWEVEDFVLLATVDGHLHARDRYNGLEIWELDAARPMVETIYHNQSDSNMDNSPNSKPFIWIVEPKEDGALYILSPGPYPTLQSLGMTIKQLAEELSPWSSTEHPIVYTAEKKNVMMVVDARTGRVLRRFSSGGSTFIDTESCEPQPTDFVGSKGSECRGIFNLGMTEYIISIHNSQTTANICTIKYFEWTPNNRDRDLHSQYSETMDNQYIYSSYDGWAIAYDHNRPKRIVSQRPVFERPFSSPVVRVFDVARPQDDDNPEPALILLPQPPGPASQEDKAKQVWLNTTEAGSWYAMSEANYPTVTDRAPQALCYNPEWSNEALGWDGEHYLPDRVSLVGVHSLDYKLQPSRRPDLPGIDAPDETEEPFVPQAPAKEDPEVREPTIIESQSQKMWGILITFLLVILTGVGGYQLGGQPKRVEALKKSILLRIVKGKKYEAPLSPTPAPSRSDPPIVEDKPVSLPPVDVTEPFTSAEQAPALEAIDTKHEGRRVKFDLPDDEDTELEPLSRTTTAEQLSPVGDDMESSAILNETANPNQLPPSTAEGDAQGQVSTPTAPVKKKKTHRGKRGGASKKIKKLKDEDEVDRIVDAAKQLDQTPSLHPDEVTMNGDDVQDVSNIKKIGKLTIDFDTVLGNGSGGTFVFAGKWNEREVAVKRMLPQYFGLAEQEVKLLQESDLHPNVIRYFDDEKDENFLYIAVEICQASLWDLYRDGRPGEELSDIQQRLVNEINCDVPRALYQLALGLNHLHSLRIIHRDIKPQNILIAYPKRNQEKGPRLVISDFGLCKTLPDNVSTLIGTTGNAGTVGWKAPELILQPRDNERNSSTGHSRESSSSSEAVSQGVKRAVDIFSLGCVFFYVLTNGSHPFDDDEGWMQIRELNIKKNKPNFKQLSLGDDSEEPIHLISWMLANRPEDRPTAIQVMNHPFFWSAEKRLNFLCDCSDHWEREIRTPPSDHLNNLEQFSYTVLDKKRNFLAKLDHGFINSLGKQRKYTGDKMLDLLRALRNKKNHYEDMEDSVKLKVGPLPHGYLRYWSTKFPKLVMACYECVGQCGLQAEPRFRPYFEGMNGA